MSPDVAKKRLSVESLSASRPSSQAALAKSFENSGAERSTCNRRKAPFLQGQIKQFSRGRLPAFVKSTNMNSHTVAVFCT